MEIKCKLARNPVYYGLFNQVSNKRRSHISAGGGGGGGGKDIRKTITAGSQISVRGGGRWSELKVFPNIFHNNARISLLFRQSWSHFIELITL